jgi:serine/threonine protein kinase
MGAVFKARQPKLNRFVALKILPESMARDPSFAERLAREGQLLARLSHPNVVSVHDFGSANGFFYLLMEYVDGVNLRQAMQAGRFTAEQALAIVPMICEALQYAHDEGVLHRDIKPENILLDTKGRVKLVDFGIAKLADHHDASSSAPSEGAPADSVLTQSGSALGTPSYMAPEQRSSPSTVDPRADIYSLGVVFYEMLTGELPTGNFAPPSTRTPMDPRVDEVVMRAMARQKEQRFRTAAEIRTSIDNITNSPAPVPNVPSAAVAHPIPIGRFFAMSLTIGLLALFVLMLPQLRYLPSYVSREVSAVANGDWFQHLATAVGVAGFAWFTMFVWRRRSWFTVALRRMPISNAVPGSLAEPLLQLAWRGVLALWAISVLWGLFGHIFVMARATAWVENLPHHPSLASLYFILAFLFPILLPVGLAVVLVRRELRRPDTFTPASPPAWMSRAGLLTVLFALVTSLPVGIRLFAQGTVVFTVGDGELVVVLALALLTRSRIWRAIALSALVAVLVTEASGLISSLFYTPWADAWADWPGEWEWPHALTGLELARLQSATIAIGICCSSIGVFALLLPSSRAAFGLPPRKRERSKPTMTSAHA